jgi:hypothetical protein
VFCFSFFFAVPDGVGQKKNSKQNLAIKKILKKCF